ncbi:putative transposase [Xenorhabdus nematophila ATCC 19061]|uniref:Transposase n=1 Tax=Xenorhabdus nematophila (strain ATCC 19061 / DSM 3370 / CCUG 14189 / LMG 1036 / NCIMB 9965 / AN6) TaxID=406817 RepID=D3VH61_XENNA|nr:putative transposase [Xenorhabdus nematophila ATCC 19061]CEK21262.1 putative transposase [Xenorhabdus nematophila AN6/1]
MQNVTLIGIDLGKPSFHIHCQDKCGKTMLRKKFTRPKLMEFLAGCSSTTVVMEACAGAHFMARRIADLGHNAKLISPQFVRPFVKSNKNDFVDAKAICEAASRPSMRFVQPRTETQQAMRALHRVRESLIRDKVKTTNQMHAFLLEFGISLPKGEAVIKRLSLVLAEHDVPDYLSRLLMKLHARYLHPSQVTENNFHAAGILLLRWGLFPGNTVQGENLLCWVSANAATKICADCGFNAPGRL